jgi:hypothetical protein
MNGENGDAPQALQMNQSQEVAGSSPASSMKRPVADAVESRRTLDMDG